MFRAHPQLQPQQEQQPQHSISSPTTTTTTTTAILNQINNNKDNRKNDNVNNKASPDRLIRRRQLGGQSTTPTNAATTTNTSIITASSSSTSLSLPTTITASSTTRSSCYGDNDKLEMGTLEKNSSGSGIGTTGSGAGTSKPMLLQRRRQPQRQRRQPQRMVLILVLLVLVSTIYLVYIPYKQNAFGDACQVALESKQYIDSYSKSLTTSLSSSLASSQTEPLSPLPKIIHQVWKDTNLPPGRFTETREAWKLYFPEPEYQHILWTDATARTLIETHFPWFLGTYDSYTMNIQRADAMRYFILYMYGGLYADLDYQPLMNFWSYLPNHAVSFVESPYVWNEKVQNSLMTSPKRHFFWNTTFEVLLERASSQRILASTGPAAMDAAIQRYQDKFHTKNNNDRNNPTPTNTRQRPQTHTEMEELMNAPPQQQQEQHLQLQHCHDVYILSCQNFQRIPLWDVEFRQRPWNVQLIQWLRYYTPLVKTCGEAWQPKSLWSTSKDLVPKDDCQFGIHHNSVSYELEFSNNLNLWAKNQ